VPTELCHLHSGMFSQAIVPPAQLAPGQVVAPGPDQRRGGFRAWLKKVFGGRPKDERPPNGPPPR